MASRDTWLCTPSRMEIRSAYQLTSPSPTDVRMVKRAPLNFSCAASEAKKDSSIHGSSSMGAGLAMSLMWTEFKAMSFAYAFRSITAPPFWTRLPLPIPLKGTGTRLVLHTLRRYGTGRRGTRWPSTPGSG